MSKEKFVFWQKPNTPLIFGITMTIAEVIARNTEYFSFFRLLAFGGLFTWAFLELTQGVNWFRRTLGAVMIALLMYDKLTNGI